MASRETSARVERMGMAMITPAMGLAALRGAIAAVALPVVGANPFLWDKFLGRVKQPTTLFENFAHRASASAPSTSGTSPASVSQPRGSKPLAAAAPVTLESIGEQVSASAAAVLGGSVASMASLMESGLDSLGSVELRNTLSKHFGIELPATLTFDYPTTAAITAFIFESIAPAVDAGVEEMAVLEGAEAEGETSLCSSKESLAVLDSKKAAVGVTGVATRCLQLCSCLIVCLIIVMEMHKLEEAGLSNVFWLSYCVSGLG